MRLRIPARRAGCGVTVEGEPGEGARSKELCVRVPYLDVSAHMQ